MGRGTGKGGNDSIVESSKSSGNHKKQTGLKQPMNKILMRDHVQKDLSVENIRQQKGDNKILVSNAHSRDLTESLVSHVSYEAGFWKGHNISN